MRKREKRKEERGWSDKEVIKEEPEPLINGICEPSTSSEGSDFEVRKKEILEELDLMEVKNENSEEDSIDQKQDVKVENPTDEVEDQKPIKVEPLEEELPVAQVTRKRVKRRRKWRKMENQMKKIKAVQMVTSETLMRNDRRIQKAPEVVEVVKKRRKSQRGVVNRNKVSEDDILLNPSRREKLGF